jgi:hypothetical protein
MEQRDVLVPPLGRRLAPTALLRLLRVLRRGVWIRGRGRRGGGQRLAGRQGVGRPALGELLRLGRLLAPPPLLPLELLPRLSDLLRTGQPRGRQRTGRGVDVEVIECRDSFQRARKTAVIVCIFERAWIEIGT